MINFSWGGNKKKNEPSSAQQAMDRLRVRIEHERAHADQPDWLPKMQADIINVIRRYIDLDPDDLMLGLKDVDNKTSVIEMNIPIHD